MNKYQIFISPDNSSDDLNSCYPWWKNFVNTVFADFDGSAIEGNLEWEALQEKVFTENKITYVDHDMVYMDSEEDFTLFLLRWS